MYPVASAFKDTPAAVNYPDLKGKTNWLCEVPAAHLCFSLFKSVQEIYVGNIAFVVRINLGHQLMELLLTHTETKAF